MMYKLILVVILSLFLLSCGENGVNEEVETNDTCTLDFADLDNIPKGKEIDTLPPFEDCSAVIEDGGRAYYYFYGIFATHRSIKYEVFWWVTFSGNRASILLDGVAVYDRANDTMLMRFDDGDVIESFTFQPSGEITGTQLTYNGGWDFSGGELVSYMNLIHGSIDDHFPPINPGKLELPDKVGVN